MIICFHCPCNNNTVVEKKADTASGYMAMIMDTEHKSIESFFLIIKMIYILNLVLILITQSSSIKSIHLMESIHLYLKWLITR